VQACQLIAGGVPELTSQNIPARVGKETVEIKPSNRKTIKVRLLSKGGAEMRLRKFGEPFAKAFNELNYMRRQQFFSGQRIDFVGTARAIHKK